MLGISIFKSHLYDNKSIIATSYKILTINHMYGCYINLKRLRFSTKQKYNCGIGA